jgi:bifunctional UDP-N-acetylglucosamine pyrophosphorylase/glucosamine-1-phosphate N-acetyltransferase
MTERHLSAIILAAGEGSRMKSERPKPLHRLCGRPMLTYVLDALGDCDLDVAAIVVGHKGEWVTKKIREEEVGFHLEFVEQREQRGTGDAALIGLVGLPDDPEDGDVLILPGDTPLLRPETIRALVDRHRATDVAATVLTMRVANPAGYGRVVRGRDDRVVRIVEHRDASPEELVIDEVNTSIYCFSRPILTPALRRLEPDNSQGELYLTDVVEVLSSTGYAVDSMLVSDPHETAGVNDRAQLAVAEAELRRRTNERLLASGVTLLDPSNTYVDTTVRVGRDVTLFPGTLLHGDTVIGDGCEIGPHTRLEDCTIGAESVVEASTGRQAVVGSNAHVGPYAVLAPGSEIPSNVTTGPFYTSSADG